ncbi:hypothetical protein CL617_00065 [archaeon]|nr:hypothetical protein [archaeon]|tara:strand:- start:999 stop:1277 length:279 start_codon:yes stop_codon:yes gene_type:complete
MNPEELRESRKKVISFLNLILRTNTIMEKELEILKSILSKFIFQLQRELFLTDNQLITELNQNISWLRKGELDSRSKKSLKFIIKTLLEVKL